MQHIANMTTRNILACGHTVWERAMSAEDLEYVKQYPDTFTRHPKGYWFNANLNNDYDRKFRASLWTDTKPAYGLGVQ
jgi:hypothetical protein